MTKAASQPNACLVLYGLGEDRRPHAARFALTDEPAVLRAAGLMDLRVARADTEAGKTLATQLTAGRIFATGRALVPFVKQAVYDQLVAQLKPLADQAAASTAASKNGAGPVAAAAAAVPKPVPATTDAKQALHNTVLIGMSSLERQRLLGLWPSQDRKVPDFCTRLAAIWDVVWLSVIQGSFGDRARPFTYVDFEKRDIEYFAPTLFKCWQQRWIWGVWAINGRWQVWTGIQSGADNKSVALLFDLTSHEVDSHPDLDAKKLGEHWQLQSARQYSAFATKQYSVPTQADAGSPELKLLAGVAAGAIGVASKLLSATPRTVPCH